MTRSRSRPALRAIALAACLCRPGLSAGQSGSAGEGALELLMPTGARAIGMGQAAVASTTGTDAIWWNPALVARPGERELSYLFAQSFFVQNDNTITAVVPISGVGSMAVSLRDIDYGEQEATDVFGPTGLLSPRTLIAIATFGAATGPLSFGLSFKFYRQTFLCSGECPSAPHRSPSTSALDLGASYARTLGRHRLVIGASTVNLGRSLQVIDAPQADPLPSRVQLGVALVPRIARLPADASLRVACDAVFRPNGVGSPGLRTGGEFDWKSRYQLRAGYALNSAIGSGLSIGVGMRTGKLQLDLARFMSDVTVSTGGSPTYLTLRYTF